MRPTAYKGGRDFRLGGRQRVRPMWGSPASTGGSGPDQPASVDTALPGFL